jgi:hypothetical protein
MVILKDTDGTMGAGQARVHGYRQDLLDWLMVAWALWWSWAYIQGALAHRFPQLLGWVHRLW